MGSAVSAGFQLRWIWREVRIGEQDRVLQYRERRTAIPKSAAQLAAHARDKADMGFVWTEWSEWQDVPTE